MYITHSGKVYPCFQSQYSVGDLKKEEMHSILRILVDEYWRNGVDTWDDCSECEFRYNCCKCKFMDHKKACKYKKECGIWN